MYMLYVLASAKFIHCLNGIRRLPFTDARILRQGILAEEDSNQFHLRGGARSCRDKSILCWRQWCAVANSVVSWTRKFQTVLHPSHETQSGSPRSGSEDFQRRRLRLSALSVSQSHSSIFTLSRQTKESIRNDSILNSALCCYTLKCLV